MATNIKPHQATRNQSLGDRRQLRLASVGTTAPGLELKALGDARQGREEDVQFATNVVPFAGGEPGNHTLWRLAHGGDIARPGRQAHSGHDRQKGAIEGLTSAYAPADQP